MRLLSRIILLLTMLLGTRQLFAWGEKGHNAIACLAQRHLTSRAAMEVSRLLDGYPMVYWSAWADGLRGEGRYNVFRTWHYANVDEGQNYGQSSKNPLGDVVAAVEHCVERLSARDGSDSLRAMYLKLLIHFVGDMHCPMHAGRLCDFGGNDHPVVFLGSATSLHHVWDSSMVDASHTWSATEWAGNIDRARSKRERRELQEGTPAEWFEGTVELCQQIYAATPREASLSWKYVNRWSPMVELQFTRAGYRLAGLLNGIFTGKSR